MASIGYLLIFIAGALSGAVVLACVRGRAGAPGAVMRGDIRWDA